jgi:CubicO group peptidase (beta-lactamase class C family)
MIAAMAESLAVNLGVRRQRIAVSTQLFLGILAWALVASVAGGQTHPALGAKAIDRVIRAQVDSGFAGVVLVAHGDSVLLRRAYGVGKNRPTLTSAFWIASVTKSFTAGAVLALQRAGRLSVRDSLYRFFPDAPKDKRTITLHQLLTHTAGFGGTYTGGGFISRTSAVRAILGQQLSYAPGHGYRYGDDDYELLAAVVEVVSGRTWQDVVQRRLLDPMGLRHTGFWCGPWRSARRPVGAADGSRTDCDTRHPDWGHRGANGMFATIDDLRTWTTAVWNGGRSASSFPEVTIPHVFVRREGLFQVYTGYGVRLYVVNDGVVEVMHSGSGDDGHTAIVRQLRAGWTIIVLSNAGLHKDTTWSSYVATQIAPRGPEAFGLRAPNVERSLQQTGDLRWLAALSLISLARC